MITRALLMAAGLGAGIALHVAFARSQLDSWAEAEFHRLTARGDNLFLTMSTPKDSSSICGWIRQYQCFLSSDFAAHADEFSQIAMVLGAAPKDRRLDALSTQANQLREMYWTLREAKRCDQ